MKKFSKLVAVVLALVMCLSLLPMSVFADDGKIIGYCPKCEEYIDHAGSTGNDTCKKCESKLIPSKPDPDEPQNPTDPDDSQETTGSGDSQEPTPSQGHTYGKGECSLCDNAWFFGIVGHDWEIGREKRTTWWGAEWTRYYLYCACCGVEREDPDNPSVEPEGPAEGTTCPVCGVGTVEDGRCNNSECPSNRTTNPDPDPDPDPDPNNPSTGDNDGCDHVDEDENGKCDKCGADMPTTSDNDGCDHVDEDEDGKCDKCGEDMPDDSGNDDGEHVHSYKDLLDGANHKCTDPECPDGNVLEPHEDAGKDGKCDKCGANMPSSPTDPSTGDGDGDGKCEHGNDRETCEECNKGTEGEGSEDGKCEHGNDRETCEECNKGTEGGDDEHKHIDEDGDGECDDPNCPDKKGDDGDETTDPTDPGTNPGGETTDPTDPDPAPAPGPGGADIDDPAGGNSGDNDVVIDDTDIPLAGEPDDEVEIGDVDVPLAALMTRAEFVNYLYVQAGSPEAELSDFTDVPEDHEYAMAIGWAQANGIAKGVSETEFAPDASVTVEQARLFLARYAQLKGIEMPELAALVGKESNEILDNATEVLAEFFGEA